MATLIAGHVEARSQIHTLLASPRLMLDHWYAIDSHQEHQLRFRDVLGFGSIHRCAPRLMLKDLCVLEGRKESRFVEVSDI